MSRVGDDWLRQNGAHPLQQMSRPHCRNCGHSDMLGHCSYRDNREFCRAGSCPHYYSVWDKSRDDRISELEEEVQRLRDKVSK